MTDDGPSSILLEYTQDKVVVVDQTGEFVSLNAAVERILGFDPDDLVGEDAFEYIHPEDRAQVRTVFERVLRADDEHSETVRYRHRTSDDDWVWLESRFSNLTDPALGGYVVTSRDISERVAAERERAATQNRLQELSRTVSDVLWMFDGDWSEVLFVNPAYEEVYGEPVAALEGDARTFLDAVHPDDIPIVEEAMDRLASGERVDYEYRVNRERDYGVTVWVQGEPIVEDGEVVRIVGFSRDVTDRKRRERQLAVMDNLLRHNIRNDMTVVLGQAELIARDGDEEIAERAEIIRREGRELLESARKQREIIDVLTEPPVPETIDVGPTLRDAAADVSDRYPDAVIEVDVEGAPQAVALHEIGTALTELLENAVQHAANGDPHVTASAGVEGDSVVVTVRDDGPPIPEEEYRVLTGEREMDDVYHSTGLGLWLVHWVVDLSDGVVEFDRVEAGNAVTVRLRLSEDA